MEQGFENENVRDLVTLEDEEGNQIDFMVEALFDMKDNSYALLTSENETILMRIEGKDLVGISDPEERDSILHAYQIAVEAAPADEEEDYIH